MPADWIGKEMIYKISSQGYFTLVGETAARFNFLEARDLEGRHYLELISYEWSSKGSG